MASKKNAHAKKPAPKPVESIRHKDKRKNIPTEELRDFVAQDESAPRTRIDISDGLAADVGHLCEESGSGEVLRADAIPISAAAEQMADGRSPLDHALEDGEDFELVFAIAPEDGQSLLANQPVLGF